MIADYEQNGTGRNGFNLLKGEEVHESRIAGVAGAEEMRMAAALRATIRVEFSDSVRGIFRQDFRRSREDNRFSFFKFLPSLFGNSKQFLPFLLHGYGIMQALASYTSHDVHTDRGYGPHTRGDCRGIQHKAAASANTGDAYFVSVHERTGSDKVYGSTEVFHVGFRGYTV